MGSRRYDAPMTQGGDLYPGNGGSSLGEPEEGGKESFREVSRTSDECFADLPDFPFEPNYPDVPDGEGGRLRIHYVDEGAKDTEPVLMMHGEPSWSFLYRKMIPIFLQDRYRAPKTSHTPLSGAAGTFSRKTELKRSPG